jgi:hypothetical protein
VELKSDKRNKLTVTGTFKSKNVISRKRTFRDRISKKKEAARLAVSLYIQISIPIFALPLRNKVFSN